ncbi:MAG TPA: hypothetical protein PK593_00045 [Thermomicrobiales bacterium]|jgi:hypothetical protein|nr:hypothetical protein [Thermomicrobiales bacterium]HQZ90488.1 hypothetical protein [Thermomicrobiales bacterium]HRA32546.1 hypothetical protein [Thermomicrobiales bacterium]
MAEKYGVDLIDEMGEPRVSIGAMAEAIRISLTRRGRPSERDVRTILDALRYDVETDWLETNVMLWGDLILDSRDEQGGAA